jgi:3',5'-cyclic AMP phosphodiesterase CpdA
VIPGNHDVYVWEAYFARHFEHAVSPYCLGDDAADGARASYPFVRVRGQVALIGCSTALPSPPPLADGWLGRRQLDAIEAALQNQAGRFRILLIHHPPLPQSLDLLRALRDRRRLQEVLRRTGCELILHGHEHRDLRGELPGPGGPIPIIGASSSTYSDPRPDRCARYNIYDVKTAPRFEFSVEQRIYDAKADAFFPAPV